jgi:hypothetical protein
LIEHHRYPIRTIVLCAEPAATYKFHAHDPSKIVSYLITAKEKTTPVDLNPAVTSTVRKGHCVSSRSRLDHVELFQRQIELSHSLDLFRRMIIIAGLIHVDFHVPNVLIAESKRAAVVVAEIDRKHDDGEEHKK